MTSPETGFFSPENPWGRRLTVVALYLVLLSAFLVTVLPFVWMISTSFKPEDCIASKPDRLLDTLLPPPGRATLEHYRELWTRIDFLRNTWNSFYISTSVTALVILINSMAGYAFAKFRFPGRERLFALLVATMMVPGQVTMMPVFILMKHLGLLNTYTGLIVPGSASVFAIFLMRQFMMGIPDELMEAARIDGCGEFRLFWQIMLPLAKPAIATLAIFTFMGAWNEFLWALIIMLEDSMYTLPVALANLQGQHFRNYGLQMAGSVVVVLPVLIVFLVMQRHYIKGIATTGLK